MVYINLEQLRHLHTHGHFRTFCHYFHLPLWTVLHLPHFFTLFECCRAAGHRDPPDPKEVVVLHPIQVTVCTTQPGAEIHLEEATIHSVDQVSSGASSSGGRGKSRESSSIPSRPKIEKQLQRKTCVRALSNHEGCCSVQMRPG